MVNFTRRVFAERKIKVEVEFSWGATEAKAADGLVDAAVEVTETGSSLRANGLRIVEELLTSTPVLVASRQAWADEWKQFKIKQIAVLVRGALDAEARVGIKMNCARDQSGQGDRPAALDYRADRLAALPVGRAQGRGMGGGRDRDQRADGARVVSQAARRRRRRHHRVPA